jgi:hypothetical protein
MSCNQSPKLKVINNNLSMKFDYVSSNFVVNGYCLGHQRSLLLHLKNNLIFNPEKSSKLVHWNQSDNDWCQWHGVTCKDGHVTDLDLSYESSIWHYLMKYMFYISRKINSQINMNQFPHLIRD